jgi:membrane protein implicated in regulation of membrane protease activity
VRPVVNGGTLGTGTPVVSALEDTISLGMSLLAILLPVAALIFLIILVYAAMRLLRRLRARRRRRRQRTAAHPDPSP